MAEITNITRTWTLGSDGVTYFETVTTDYDNEEQKVVKKLIGKAGKLAEYYADNFEQISQTMATNAAGIARPKRDLNELDGDAADILAITGVDPLLTIQARYEAELLAPGWTIDEGAGFIPIVFSKNAQGKLRYNVNGTGNKNATIYGKVIQLNNYPVSGPTEFYLADNGRQYFSLPNKQYKIKKP